jgi:hypothetical protein
VQTKFGADNDLRTNRTAFRLEMRLTHASLACHHSRCALLRYLYLKHEEGAKLAYGAKCSDIYKMKRINGKGTGFNTYTVAMTFQNGQTDMWFSLDFKARTFWRSSRLKLGSKYF